MNKWAVSNKVLRKMLEIAKGKGFKSTKDYLNSVGKDLDIIDFDKAPIKTFRQTISSEGKYPKRFYNIDGTGNTQELSKLVNEGETYRGVPGTTKDPLAGLVDEIPFNKSRQAEVGKPVDRFHTMHLEKAYATDKASVVYTSKVENLLTNPADRPWRLRGHYGNPGIIPPKKYLEDIHKTFKEGRTPREAGRFKEVPGKTPRMGEHIPTYELMSDTESLPERVGVLVPHNLAKRKFTDLGVMNHAQIKWKAKQLQDKAKLFY